MILHKLLRAVVFVGAAVVAPAGNDVEHQGDPNRQCTHNTDGRKDGLDCSEDGAECTRSQLKVYFGCSDGERPIHDQKTWQYLRQTYHDILGAEKSTIGLPNRPFNGFSVPYYVGQSDGRGRGLFAAKDIPKSGQVWTAVRTAEFEDAETYRDFLFAIPADLACDVMLWAYVAYDAVRGYDTDDEDDEDDEEEEGVGDDEEDEILKIMVDLDEMSFCNDGGDKKSNLDWNSEVAAQYPNDSDFGRVFAMEEVKEGSELLCNYSGFFEKDKWKFFRL